MAFLVTVNLGSVEQDVRSILMIAINLRVETVCSFIVLINLFIFLFFYLFFFYKKINQNQIYYIYFVFCCSMLCFNFFNFHLKSIFRHTCTYNNPFKNT